MVAMLGSIHDKSTYPQGMEKAARRKTARTPKPERRDPPHWVCEILYATSTPQTRNMKPETQTPKSEARGPPRWICEIMPAHSTAETRDPRPETPQK